MDQASIDVLEASDQMLVGIGCDIWLMDDHRWAFYAWMQHSDRTQVPSFSLVHADYHWDGVNDFHDDEVRLAELRAADLPQLYEMVLHKRGVQFDSFIAPAVLRGIVRDVHFFCRQYDEEIGLDPDLLDGTGTRQYIHETVDSLASAEYARPLIFDLCLDLFNDSDMLGEGELWADAEIEGWLMQVQPLIQRATLVTVSLSFDYSGTEDDTRHLASLVIPRLIEWRSAS